MPKAIKCPICKRKYVNLEGLGSHIERVHGESIPKHMESGAQYYYFLRTGKAEGKCTECGAPTKWNSVTNKYSRLCGKPSCKKAVRDRYLARMIGKYNKTTLLKDPAHQRKMLMGRSISGQYSFKDGTKIDYVGSYEKDFLQFMDVVFNWDPADIISPSPNTYYYEYKGEKHFYIPDIYIPSLDLNIEIKDGGNNPNKHHKIQDVDKVKEAAKDAAMMTLKSSYIKLYNKNYGNFVLFLNKLKERFVNGDKNNDPIYLIEDHGKVKTTSESTRFSIKEGLLPKEFPFRYDNTRKLVDKSIKSINSEMDIKKINKLIKDIVDRVDMDIANDDAFTTEGEKLKEYLRTFAKAAVENKAYEIEKRKRRAVTESSIPDKEIYTKDTSTEINETTCPKGFYFKEENGAIRWNAIKWIDGKPWRDCVEALVFKGNKVFLLEKDGVLLFPGGSKSPDIPDIKQVENEINEEAKFEIATIVGPIANYSFQYPTIKGNRFGDFNYVGRTVDVYYAKFKSKYMGKVAKADLHENMSKHGKFVSISDVYDEVTPAHRKVIDAYLGSGGVNE